MNNKQIEVYEFYKKEYPGHILFFHVKDKYAVLSKDIGKVANFLHYASVPDVMEFKDTDVEILSALGDAGAKIQIISYLNDSGEYDFPDIKLLKQEKLEDY